MTRQEREQLKHSEQIDQETRDFLMEQAEFFQSLYESTGDGFAVWLLLRLYDEVLEEEGPGQVEGPPLPRWVTDYLMRSSRGILSHTQQGDRVGDQVLSALGMGSDRLKKVREGWRVEGVKLRLQELTEEGYSIRQAMQNISVEMECSLSTIRRAYYGKHG